MTMRFLITLALLLTFGNSHSQVFLEELGEKLDSVCQKYQIPGIAAAAITSDTIYYGFAGTIRMKNETKVNAESKWHLGSCTKAVTSFIAAKMVADGQISFDDKLRKIVPALKKKMRKEYKNVTLGDLLSHRAGIREYTQGLEFMTVPAFEGTVHQKRMAFAKFVLRKAPVKPAELGYVYSNAGYVLAALMLEEKSGKTWEELVAKTFQELKMAYFVGFPNRERPTNPWGHQAMLNDSIVEIAPDNDYALRDYMAPAGDLSMTLKDYSTLIQLHLKGLRGESNYLDAQMYQRIHFGIENYGYGWINRKSRMTGEPLSTHDGSAGVSHCHAMIFPESDMAIVVLMNISSKKSYSAIPAIGQYILAHYKQ